MVPDEKIVIETDAPYLTPVPHRGKMNEPSFVKFTAEKIAEIKDVSFDYIAKITSQNAERIFGI